MEEEFLGGVCGENWWNSSRNLFSSSLCSAAVNGLGSPRWVNPGLALNMKTAKSISGDSDGGSSIVLQEAQRPQSQLTTNGNMPIDWNQDLLHDSARSQPNYSHMEWTTLDFSPDSSGYSFRQSFLLDQQPKNSFSSFPLNTPPPHEYTSSSPFYTEQAPLHNFRMNSNGFLPAAYMMKPSLRKQQPFNNFHFINNTAFGNATSAASPGDVHGSFMQSSTPQLIPSALTKARYNQQNFSSKHDKVGRADSTAKKSGNEPSLKRPRTETPSPLPTFKVRKEKLGDRVTALQQLVSPFGKTDTASVLQEAIEYIKLLHDQVTVLSTPYLKKGPPLQRQQGKDEEEPTKDLRSRGLRLVPISSTTPVANETTADFWTPTFGASFRE